MTTLSPTAATRIEEEIARLREIDKPAALDAITEARQDGISIAENVGYLQARAELDRIEARISDLTFTLSQATVVEASDTSVVSHGCVVVVDMDGDELRYLVGSIIESAPGVDVVSSDSPLGQALLGKAVGDTVEWASPRGSILTAVVLTICVR